MAALATLIRTHGYRRGVELGVWQGATFGYLLGAFPTLNLIGVDNWEAAGPYADKDMAAAEKAARTIARVHLSRSGILKMSTVDAAKQFADGSLDFVFIDASHDTESVAADIRAWRSKVRAGGALCGHDADWPSVQAALNQELTGWREIGGNVWIST